MNYIAGMLLLQLNDEKLAYLCLLYIMYENNWRELYVPGMEKLFAMINKLSRRLEKTEPDVYAHFHKKFDNYEARFDRLFGNIRNYQKKYRRE